MNPTRSLLLSDKDLRRAQAVTNLCPPVAPLPVPDCLIQELKTEIEQMKSQMSIYSATFAGLHMGRELGGGAFGTVYEAVTGYEKVAIKVLKADKMARLSQSKYYMNLNEFYGEALLLSNLNHRNILSFKFIIYDVPPHGLPGMTTEFVSDDLFCFIRRAGGLKNWKNVWTIAKQVADGLKYLHSKKVVHFDIKSSNILVEYSHCPAPNILCKVADFGHMVENYTGVMRLNSKRGTMGYMAPEVIRASRTNMEVVTEKVDVYSYGMLLWELIMGVLPHSGMSIEQMGPRVLKGLRLEVPNWCDSGWKSLMEACWSEDQRQRPSFDHIVANFSSLLGTPSGQRLMMMGTADEIVKAPEKDVVFMEDLPEEEQAVAVGHSAGLFNLGNTCYMNSTLQCLRSVPELKSALLSYNQSNRSGDLDQPSHFLTVAIRDLFNELERNAKPVAPMHFWMTLRKKFPQFGQQHNGAYMQQDAEECWTQLMYTLSQSLKPAERRENTEPVKTLFEIELVSRIHCAESSEESTETESVYSLKCHISHEVNHLHEGLKHGLKSDLEKMSPSLDRTAIYLKESRINSLPKYISINVLVERPDERNDAILPVTEKVKKVEEIAVGVVDNSDDEIDEAPFHVNVARDGVELEGDKFESLNEHLISEDSPVATYNPVLHGLNSSLELFGSMLEEERFIPTLVCEKEVHDSNDETKGFEVFDGCSATNDSKMMKKGKKNCPGMLKVEASAKNRKPTKLKNNIDGQRALLANMTRKQKEEEELRRLESLARERRERISSRSITLAACSPTVQASLPKNQIQMDKMGWEFENGQIALRATIRKKEKEKKEREHFETIAKSRHERIFAKGDTVTAILPKIQLKLDKMSWELQNENLALRAHLTKKFKEEENKKRLETLANERRRRILERTLSANRFRSRTSFSILDGEVDGRLLEPGFTSNA